MVQGGIPVIFPQFGPGALPQHGFVRNALWKVAETKFDPSQNSISISLCFLDDETTRAVWPHNFRAVMTTEISFVSGTPVLTQKFSVENTGSTDLTFTTALHTYFGVSSIKETTISPLNVKYLDKILAAPAEPHGPSVGFTGPTDRVYYNAPDKTTILEKNVPKVSIERIGYPDVVIWNCWEEASVKMADMGDHDWVSYVCNESALIGQSPFLLKQGATWHGSQKITVEKN